METLDSQWKEIRGTLEGGGGGGGGGGGRGGEDYDRAVRELLYEKRARATDRLKTDEEVAKDEREKLVAMEVFMSQSITVYACVCVCVCVCVG